MAHFEGTMKYIYKYYLFYFINKNWLIEYVKYETTCMHVSLLGMMLQMKQHK